MAALGIDSEFWLVESMKQGNDNVFELLYAEHYRSIYALVLRLLCDPAKTEDVVEEVFISVWRGIEGFRGESSIFAWIRTIAVRAAKRRWKHQPEAQLDEASIARYERIAAGTFPDTRLRLERAIATLPTGARAVLLLHDVYGYKQSEIADLLDVAVGTVKAQLHRTRNLMKQELQR